MIVSLLGFLIRGLGRYFTKMVSFFGPFSKMVIVVNMRAKISKDRDKFLFDWIRKSFFWHLIVRKLFLSYEGPPSTNSFKFGASKYSKNFREWSVSLFHYIAIFYAGRISATIQPKWQKQLSATLDVLSNPQI